MSRRQYMYGDGLMRRRARYTSKGSARVGKEIRRERTVWITSPAAIYALAFFTASTI